MKSPKIQFSCINQILCFVSSINMVLVHEPYTVQCTVHVHVLLTRPCVMHMLAKEYMCNNYWLSQPAMVPLFTIVNDTHIIVLFLSLAVKSQISKDRSLDFDPTCVSYFPTGEFAIIAGSSKKVYVHQSILLCTPQSIHLCTCIYMYMGQKNL